MFITCCVDLVRVASESRVLLITLKFVTIMLMLDAQQVSLLCSKGVTNMLHYA